GMRVNAQCSRQREDQQTEPSCAHAGLHSAPPGACATYRDEQGTWVREEEPGKRAGSALRLPEPVPFSRSPLLTVGRETTRKHDATEVSTVPGVPLERREGERRDDGAEEQRSRGERTIPVLLSRAPLPLLNTKLAIVGCGDDAAELGPVLEDAAQGRNRLRDEHRDRERRHILALPRVRRHPLPDRHQTQPVDPHRLATTRGPQDVLCPRPHIQTAKR